jgi:hypothetical protein
MSTKSERTFASWGGTHPAMQRLSVLPCRALRDIPDDDVQRVCEIYINAAHAAMDAAVGSKLDGLLCLLMISAVYAHAVRQNFLIKRPSQLTNVPSNPSNSIRPTVFIPGSCTFACSCTTASWSSAYADTATPSGTNSFTPVARSRNFTMRPPSTNLKSFSL